METESLSIRVHGDDSLPTLVYLPGIHGDWTLVSSFRERLRGHVRFVEFTYPRTLEWSLEDYARAVLDRLAAHRIREGVLVGESFGSQILWSLLAILREPCRVEEDGKTVRGNRLAGSALDPKPRFVPKRAILAGGFVRYPWLPLVDFTRVVWAILPAWLVRGFFHGYAIFARWRHRHAPETAGAIREFVSRRTMADLAAMGHRLKLIRLNNPADAVRHVEIPVFHLAGFWDPVVWWPSVKTSLKANCPGYQESRIISGADHNVLGTAPDQAAGQVLAWLR